MTMKSLRGPKWKDLYNFTKYFELGNISFQAPKSNPPFPDRGWEMEPDTIPRNFDLVYSQEIQQRGGVSALIIHSSSWKYTTTGLLRSYQGHVNMFVELVKCNDLPVNESIYTKDVFERVINSEICNSFLGKKHPKPNVDSFQINSDEWPSYLCPLNCKTIKINSRNWLYYDSQPLVDGPTNVIISTPIGHDTYIEVSFTIVRSTPKSSNAYTTESIVDISEFSKLVKNIIKSIKVSVNNDHEYDLPTLSPKPEDLKLAPEVLMAWSGRGVSKKRHDLKNSSIEIYENFVTKRASTPVI